MKKDPSKSARKLFPVLAGPFLAAFLAFMPFIPLSGHSAEGLDASEWQTVAGAIDSYIDSQYLAADDGEAGFLIEAAELKARLDSNGDNVYLGEGDDAANAPVLIDALISWGNWIPGTSYRITSNYQSAANTTNAPAVAQKVTNHRSAGFTDEIVVYCATGHVENIVVMNYGAMAHAGYFGAPTPVVRGLKWARLGWGDTWGAPGYSTYTKPYSAGPIATPGPYALASNSNCTGTTPAGELVRCTANAVGGAASNGDNPWASASDASYQPVDIRPGVDYYIADNSGNAYSYNVPLQTLFDATGGTYDNLSKLDPGTSKLIALYGRTQHSGLLAAQGARMLGYNTRSIRFGVPYWNGATPPNWQEKWVSNPGYAMNTSGSPDETAPVISAVDPGVPASTSAAVTWSTNEPATTVLEYGTSPGGPYTKINDTILHASHGVSLTGLSESTTYYYKVTSYDGRANGTSSAEYSFTTTDVTAPSITSLAPAGTIYAGSTTVSADYSDGGSGIDSSTAKIYLDGSPTELGGCTSTGTGISCPVTGLAYGPHTFSVEVKDNAGNTATDGSGAFTVGDNVAPAVTYSGPTGDINTASPTITGTYTDAAPTSGVNIGSAMVSIDSGPVQTCTASGGSINCPVSGLADGAHSAVISIKDNDNNTGSSSAGSFTVDTTVPVVSNVTPSGWVTSASPTIEADLSDGSGSGIDTSTATISLDSGPALSGCATIASHISCPASGLAQGSHTISVSVSDNAGNAGGGSGSFDVDTTAPSISSLAPTGTIYSSSTTVSADYSDGGSGIDTATAKVYLDGSPTELGGCSATGTGISCPVTGLAYGPHTFSVEVKDNAANTATDSGGSFTIGDNVAPAVTYSGPTGVITTDGPTITGTYSDAAPSSGVNTGSATVSIDSGPAQACTASGGSINCPVSGLADGAHSAVISIDDNDNNTGSSSAGSFTVDTTVPVVSNVTPSGWVTSASPTIEADLSDGSGSGIDTATASISLDGGPALGSCTVTTSHISCPASGLANGSHTIAVSVSDNAGNAGTGSGSFSVDTAAPSISSLAPSGTVYSGSTTVSADYSDGGSGIDSSTAKVFLDSSPTALTGCTASATGISCPVSGLAFGAHTFSVEVADNAGNSATDGSGSFTFSQRSYGAAWYDNNISSGATQNWLMLNNEDTTDATVDIFVGDMSTPVADDLAVAAGAVIAWQSPTPLTGGPVRVVSTNGQALGVSQRVIYQDSFNEVEVEAASALASEHYFPWYDYNPAGGMNGDWVMVANLGGADTTVDIFVGDMTTPVADDVAVAAGTSVPWQSPTPLTDGPVKVVGANSGDKLVASQRVLYGASFNEAMGIATSRLDDQAWFTWYDSAMGSNWVMVANLGSSDTTVDIFVGDMTTPKVEDLAVAQNGTAYSQSDVPFTDGPVKVVGANSGDKLAITQRVLYKGSFEETAPTYVTELASNADFTWYDNAMGGNWVMAVNADTTDANVDISIAGTSAGTLNPVAANGGKNYWISPTALTTGPVRVTNTGSAKLVISQRVIYKNSFNELVGRPR